MMENIFYRSLPFLVLARELPEVPCYVKYTYVKLRNLEFSIMYTICHFNIIGRFLGMRGIQNMN